MRAALVELRIDPSREPSNTQLGFGEVLLETVRSQPESREAAVRTALQEVAGAEWVVFPGWTLVAEALPGWMLEASTGRTVAFELVSADRTHSAETHVLRNSVSVIRAKQKLFEAEDDPGALIDEIERGVRRFDGGMLWICGEVEVLDGGRGGRTSVRNETGLPPSDLRSRVAINVAHTSESLPASQSKRAWLSTDGWLLRAANFYTGGWNYWEFKNDLPVGPFRSNASHQGAKVWRDGVVVKSQKRTALSAGAGGFISWIDLG